MSRAVAVRARSLAAILDGRLRAGGTLAPLLISVETATLLRDALRCYAEAQEREESPLRRRIMAHRFGLRRTDGATDVREPIPLSFPVPYPSSWGCGILSPAKRRGISFVPRPRMADPIPDDPAHDALNRRVTIRLLRHRARTQRQVTISPDMARWIADQLAKGGE